MCLSSMYGTFMYCVQYLIFFNFFFNDESFSIMINIVYSYIKVMEGIEKDSYIICYN